MNSRSLRGQPLLALLLGIILLASPPVGSTVSAAGASPKPIDVFGVSQQDLDGDQLPDLTVIDAAFATPHDRVFVLDRDGDMRAGVRWQDVTDFEDDIWIFDAGADGTAQLIVAFAQEDGRAVAYFFVDENGDAQVSYELTGKRVAVTESPRWRLRVAAKGNWLLPDGRLNPNLVMSVDGTLTRLLDSYVGLSKGSWAEANLATDGKIDWEIETGDQDRDGQADYALTRLLTPIPDYFSAFRGSLYVDRNPRRSIPYTNSVFWPFLIGTANDESGRYFDNPPAIKVDWEKASVYQAGALGYPAEQGYHILSSAPTWRKGQVNDVLWENPLAYYNLAMDEDYWPELLIRVVTPLWLEAIPDQPQAADMLQVEYTWDQNNDGNWDYEVSVAGKRPVDGIIEFPDISFRTIPYEQLPSWTTEYEWDAAFFVVGEDGGRADSESLWIWDFSAGFPGDVKSTYLSGYTTTAPTEPFDDIAVGYRGEYSFEYGKRPVLYFSPADRRLHLKGAKVGVWNLEEGHYLRYADTDGDQYLDQWQEQYEGDIVQQLDYGRGVYVLSSGDRVQIKRTAAGPAVFDVTPPRNNQEWLSLDARLKAQGSAADPVDFTGALGQLEGLGIQVDRATVRDIRSSDDGLRFVLELHPGFHILSDQIGLATFFSTAGAYLVQYDGSTWSARPLSAPSLTAGDLRVGTLGGRARALEWITVDAVLHNGGLEDARDVPVCAAFDGPGGERDVISKTVGLVPGEGWQRSSWDWSPPTSGRWRVVIAAGCSAPYDDTSAGQFLAEAGIEVGDNPPPTLSWLITLGGRVPPAIILLASGIGAVAGLVAAAWLRLSKFP